VVENVERQIVIKFITTVGEGIFTLLSKVLFDEREGFERLPTKLLF